MCVQVLKEQFSEPVYKMVDLAIYRGTLHTHSRLDPAYLLLNAVVLGGLILRERLKHRKIIETVALTRSSLGQTS